MVTSGLLDTLKKEAISMKKSEASSHKGTKEFLSTGNSGAGIGTIVTRVTEATTNVSKLDVCYGNISLGIYKMAKVAVKPISEFRQSRKLMIELRSVSSSVEWIWFISGAKPLSFKQVVQTEKIIPQGVAFISDVTQEVLANKGNGGKVSIPSIPIIKPNSQMNEVIELEKAKL